MNRLELIEINEEGNYIMKPFSDDDRGEMAHLIRKGLTSFDVIEHDDDLATAPQKAKAHALIRSINEYWEKPKIAIKRELKCAFWEEGGYGDWIESSEPFSLRNCSKELASEFISYLVEYCFMHDIDFYMKDLHLTFDVNRQMFLCAKYNRCFATGAKRETNVLHLHHVSAIGMGGNRNDIDHRGRYFMILKAVLHDEIHQIGYKAFVEKWHCGTIKLTGEDVLRFGLMSRKQMNEIDDELEIQSWQLGE